MNTRQQIRKLIIGFAIIFITPQAIAKTPNVVASIKPVEALVLAVMGEQGKPELLLAPGTSPHSFTIKPSQARLLSNANVVFWVGPRLETSLEGPLKSLSNSAKVIRLMDTPGLKLIKTDDGATDPHIWLSVHNAKMMTRYIAERLSLEDPENAGMYDQNSKSMITRLDALKHRMTTQMDAIKGTAYVVMHDGFSYIADEFNLREVGHIQSHGSRQPGAKHVAKLRSTIGREKVRCLFIEPQLTPTMAENMAHELGLQLAEVDPMGVNLTTDDTLYLRILEDILVNMNNCLNVK